MSIRCSGQLDRHSEALLPKPRALASDVGCATSPGMENFRIGQQTDISEEMEHFTPYLSICCLVGSRPRRQGGSATRGVGQLTVEEHGDRRC